MTQTDINFIQQALNNECIRLLTTVVDMQNSKISVEQKTKKIEKGEK